jgi:hypothetical protein
MLPTRTSAISIVVILSTFATASCARPLPDDGGMTDDTGSASVDFEMTLMGYPHDGQNVELVVFEAGTANVVSSLGGTIAGMELVLSDTGQLQDGGSYDIHWYVDVNENGACDPPPDDHAWGMLEQVAGATGLSLSHVHDANWVDACGNF